TGSNCKSDGVPGTVVRWISTEWPGPIRGDVTRLESSDHHDLQQRIQHCPNRHSGKNRARYVAFRIARFSGKLNCLFKPLQSKHDASSQRSEDTVKAERHKTTTGMEVFCVEPQHCNGADGEYGHSSFPDHYNHVAVG